MARSDGVIDRISGIDAARAVPGVKAVEMYKAEGQECLITHDFRDRIGHVIAVVDQPEGAEAAAGAADRARDAIAVRLRGDTGRLKKPPSPALRRILLETPPEVASADLMLISQVDLSHVLMLSECGIVGSAEANTLLKSILELRAADFAPLRNRPQDRGLYLMYEEYLRDTCGERIGGMLQTGRSRNDLNATTARLKARMLVRRLMGEAFRLQAALIHAAESHTGTVMPAYTHGQAAVPITYGHYLAGSAEALSREVAHLLASLHDLSRCPLGAGAVGGTSFPIRPERSAELLGFSDTCANSLDAVASRDYVLRLLACAAGISVLLSRIAADYFQWCTAEFGFIDLPDEMVGSSSAMPQKRNPFLLEHVAGRAGLTLGRYTSAAAAMLHAPFSNSIAVGTEAVKALSTALIETAESALLLRLVVRAARPNHPRMLESASRGHTVALELANRLVRDAGLDFRAAHRLTGELVNDCVERAGLLSDKGSADFLARRGLRVEVENLTVPRVAADARFGGGPAEEAVRTAIYGLKAVWFRQRAAYRRLRQRWSDSESELLSAAAERAK
jgi:argininosuccinate lyase